MLEFMLVYKEVEFELRYQRKKYVFHHFWYYARVQQTRNILFSYLEFFK